MLPLFPVCSRFLALHLPLLAAAALFASSAHTAWAQAGSLTLLSSGSFNVFSLYAAGVSRDGTVVVGTADGRAFRWTQAGGMTSLGGLNGGTASQAYATSADGAVVVGFAWDGAADNATRAFRWTQAGGMVSLGTLSGGNFTSYRATGVSGDGTLIVGTAIDYRCILGCLDNSRAYRWTQAGGMVSLGVLNGGDYSYATGVSADGAVVVGNAADGAAGNAQRAFRWTQAGGMVSLGVLNGGNYAQATGVSADGAVVVGNAYDGAVDNVQRAFRWTQDGGMVSLGVLSNGDRGSYAAGVSGDGKVIVGYSEQPIGGHPQRGFRWTQAGGMQSVVDWLRAAGVAFAGPVGWEYLWDIPVATNYDGSVIVGSSGGLTYIARVAPEGSGMVTLADVSQSLGSAAQAGNMLLSSVNLLMNGAHSRPLARRVAAGQRAFWAAGDVGRDDHGARDGNLGLAEIGLNWHTGVVQINTALGQTRARQNMTLGGRVKADGTYAMAEALLPLNANPSGGLWAVLGGYGHWGDADIRRGYLNAGVSDVSMAQPNVQTWALRAHLEWDRALQWGGAALSPYTALSYARTRLDGYTETGGGFPARFDARSEGNTELRLGMNGVKPLSGGARLTGIVEGVHRFEKTGTTTSGQVVGLFGFNLPGEQFRQNWVRAGAGVESKLADGVASLMLNATSRGEAPNLWLAASWQKTF